MKRVILCGYIILCSVQPVLAEQATISENENGITVEYNGSADTGTTKPAGQDAAAVTPPDSKAGATPAPASDAAAAEPAPDHTPSGKERRSQLQAIKDAQREMMLKSLQPQEKAK